MVQPLILHQPHKNDLNSLKNAFFEKNIQGNHLLLPAVALQDLGKSFIYYCLDAILSNYEDHF